MPLPPALRRPGALPLCGFRDLLLCGDVRQLPPASGRAPFWSTQTFQTMFEVFRLREDRRHERDPAMRELKEKMAWGGSLPEPGQGVATAWPVDPDVEEFIDEGYLRGWGLTADSVDLDLGTALFPRRADVRRYNDGCIEQIERLFGEVTQGVDVHGCDWRDGKTSTVGAGSKQVSQGLQTPAVLKLRTSAKHRLRVMVLHNQDVANGWANGTRARLLAHDSWTGKPRVLQPGAPCRASRARTWSADQIHLEDPRHIDFNVRVVKDEESTLARRARYDAADVQCIPVRSDESSSTHAAWRQVQLTLAYGLTGHKSQSLTMRVTYISLGGTFGYGLPYTLVTRTPFRHNMSFIGVPPSDVLARLLHRDAKGLTLVGKKKASLAALLADDSALLALRDARITSGEFDIDALARAWLADDTAAARGSAVAASSTQPSPGQLAAAVDAVLDDLLLRLRGSIQAWHDRLDVAAGLRAMCTVSEGFSYTDRGIVPWRNRQNLWADLAGVLQQDAATRTRILHYRRVATDWFGSALVDVLSMADASQLCRPLREQSSTAPFLHGRIVGYTVDSQCQSRPPCPQPPPGFEWGAGKVERVSRPAEAEVPPPTAAPGGAPNEAASTPPPAGLSSTSHRPRDGFPYVAVPKDRGFVAVERCKRLRILSKRPPDPRDGRPPAGVPWPGSAASGGNAAPRPFANLGFSCFVNASLTALFGPAAFRDVFRTIVSEEEASLRESLWPAATSASVDEPGSPATTTEEQRLAVTYYAAMRPSTGADPLKRGSAVVPWLFTRRHFRGAQEDAQEFLMRVLQARSSPRLHRLCLGLDEPLLLCGDAGCGASRAAAPEAFSWLQLPLRGASGLLTTVQAALNSYLAPAPVGPDFSWSCPHPGCGSRSIPSLQHRLVELPRVLCVQLVRWRHTELAEDSAILDPVSADPELLVGACRYGLRSLVCHSGATVWTGHYTCRLHHPGRGGPWWHYNNSTRRRATPAEIDTTAPVRGVPERSYILFYERLP